MRYLFANCAVLLATATTAHADVTSLVKSLSVHPAKLTLNTSDDAAQVIVTAIHADGRQVDVTHEATFAISNPSLATISASGRVVPKANGTGELRVSLGTNTVRVPLVATQVGESLPINFANQIVPIFTKLGCNSGGCHGKSTGQNGFKLSLLGFEPELDFMTLVKESRGRRLLPNAPDASLFLQKAIGKMPHGGGRKLDVESDEYKLIRRWIALGMPWGNANDPVVTKISVYPDRRVMSRQNRQQIAVYAHYSDGKLEDITRRAQYESNDGEVATVDGAGLVRTLSLSGQAAVMARYQGFVGTFLATIPLDTKTPAYQFAAKSKIDELVAKKWTELGLVPSELASDEVFIRRVYLDVTGTLPTPTQVRAFLADTSANKRDTLVDHLVETPEYAYFFANKWADILRVKRRGEQNRASGTFAFHAWIREAISSDLPFDEFVRAIVTANGDETNNPPSVWFREIDKPEQFVDDLSQVFLGQRLTCAQCHHHPYEKWSQDDYWGLAAFYGRVGRKTVPTAGADPNRGQRQLIYTKATGTVTNKRTNQPALTKPLDAESLTIDSTDDPRQKLADWMTSPKNPFLAKTVANRYWAHFFTRGIVDPLDDMRVTNPPSNPELLEELTKVVIDNKFSLKALVKAIVKSRVYHLSATPNEFNKQDKQAYARYYPKRMSAEVMLDAVNQVTNAPQSFGNLPRDKHAPSRAIMLPDESFSSYFLEVFGRPQRNSACECERVNEANLAQALHLLNSDDIQGKVTRGGGRAELLSKADDKRSDAEKIDELFLWALGRKATDADRKAALDHIDASVKKNAATGKRTAYENLLWAVINTKEFAFVQ